MGITSIPAPAGGGIKTVQRGSAVSSGTITITAVNLSKSFVTVFGTASTGTVTSGSAMNVSSSNLASFGYSLKQSNSSGNVTFAFSGGTNNLVSAVVQGYLSSSTELVVSGACRWEVVEFA